MSTTAREYVIATNCDDWEGLYLNGYRVTEGHELQITDFVETVVLHGGVITDFYRIEVDNDWLVELGSLPEHIGDIVWADHESIPGDGFNTEGIPR